MLKGNVGRNCRLSCSSCFCLVMVECRCHDKNVLNLSNLSHFTPNSGLGKAYSAFVFRVWWYSVYYWVGCFLNITGSSPAPVSKHLVSLFVLSSDYYKYLWCADMTGLSFFEFLIQKSFRLAASTSVNLTSNLV